MRAIRLGLVVACLLLEVRVVRAEDAFVFRDVDPLPENTWIKLSTPQTSRYLPRNFTDCSLMGRLPHPVARSHSGVVPGDGKLFYFGGGDRSHPANDVELYDITRHVWLEQYTPECIPACCCVPECDPTNPCADACRIIGGVGTHEITAEGLPFTEHVYRLVTWNPVRKRFFAALTSGSWEYDPDTTKWTRLTTSRPASSGIESKHVAYDPNVGILFFATAPASGPPSVYRFDFDQSAWVLHGRMPDLVATEPREIYSAFDTNHGKHLVSWHGDGGHLFLYDAAVGTEPNAGAWNELASVPAAARCVGENEIPDNCAASLAYDPNGGVFVVGRKQPDDVIRLWTYDPIADEWGAFPLAGYPPRSLYSGLWGTLAYDAGSGLFYFVNVRTPAEFGTGGVGAGDLETWVFRRSPTKSSDANCDGWVSAADLPAAVSLAAKGEAPPCGKSQPVAIETTIEDIFAVTRSGAACADANDLQASFAIGRGEDDGFIRSMAATYPPDQTTRLEVNADGSVVAASRTLVGSVYQVYTGLLRWDTSALPDDAIVTQGWLSLGVADVGDTDGLQLTAGWYPWTGPLISDDWTGTPETDALPGTNVSALVSGQRNSLPLQIRPSRISTSGVTSLRLHIGESPGNAPPTGQNFVTWDSVESSQGARLIVCYRRPR